jgi:hypothetical protein
MTLPDAEAPDATLAGDTPTPPTSHAPEAGNAALCEELDASERPAPTPLPEWVGTPLFHRSRHDDFVERHRGALPAPSYYLGEGEAFAEHLATVVRPGLSREGQAWLFRALEGIERAIEERLARDPDAFDALERDADAFEAFAQAARADALVSAGLADLEPADLARIAGATDLGERVMVDGVLGIEDPGARVLGELAERGAGEAWDWARHW